MYGCVTFDYKVNHCKCINMQVYIVKFYLFSLIHLYLLFASFLYVCYPNSVTKEFQYTSNMAAKFCAEFNHVA